ncbi:iron-containing alcohol dehydrogenase [Simkania negevensis]|uniref:Iron-containing alcohol dehydrogenase n=1 Tax=Simkania negevensis TaxID=83561 RepID=A0ABS3AU88_9BACT|nr:iron-containing alcohol dehydrogenase [Simkania negevensis]
MFVIPHIQQGDIDLQHLHANSNILWITSASIIACHPWLQEKRHEVVQSADWSKVVECRTSLGKEYPERIIAFGGGKVLDVAKLTARLITTDTQTLQAIQKRRCTDEHFTSTIPLTLIPSTCGSGSEGSSVTVITYQGTKYPISHRTLVADEVILSPHAIASCPDKVFKNGLWDTFVHAIESYSSPLADPTTQQAALCALHIVLPVLQQGRFTSPHSSWQWASLLAGAAQSTTSVGLAHAIAHQLEPLGCGMHGELVAQMLPKAMTLNAEKRDGLYDALAQKLLFSNGRALINEIILLAERDWGTPAPLALDSQQIDQLVTKICKDPCYRTNPSFIPKRDLTHALHNWHLIKQ